MNTAHTSSPHSGASTALNATQRAALASVADGHPAGTSSTFRALMRRGLVKYNAEWRFAKQRYALTDCGYEVWRASSHKESSNG